MNKEVSDLLELRKKYRMMLPHSYGTYISALIHWFDSPEAEQVFKNDERYRWMRGMDAEWAKLFADPIKWDGGGWCKLGSRWVREHLDAAIDAAKEQS